MSERDQIPTCQVVSESKKPEDNSSAKRPREESSDVEVDLPCKKARIEELSNDKNSSSNGSKEHENESIQVDEKKVVENDIKHKETASNDPINITVASEKMTIDLKDASYSGEKEIDRSQDDEDTDRKNDIENGIVNGKHEETITKDEMFINDESNQNEKMSTGKKKKNRKEDSEIINGVELTVECASDKESSEQSEEEKSEKPRTKTIIVREKPNNSEVDASSSDSEKSNSSNASKIKSSVKAHTSLKAIEKKSAEKGKIKSSTNLSSTSENSAESSSNDEDYSPIAKKVKKSSPKRNANNSTEAKRGRGRPRGRPPKNSNNVLEKPLAEENKKDMKEYKEEKVHENIEKKINKKLKDSNDNTESKNEESINTLSTNEKSDYESNNHSGINKNEEKERKISKRNLIRIQNLKKCIKAAGIRVNYKTLLEDGKTDAAKVRILSNFLEEHGIVGRPSMEKCAKLKKKNETQKEVQELDTNNIISETRVTRGARNIRKSKVEPEIPASPVQKLRNRIKAVVDSDSE